MKYTPVTFDRSDESAKALESGRCDTLASDQSQLYALRFSIVRWSLFAMLNAEEMGINSQNVDE